MLSLGIEATAHTFGVGIVDEKGKVLTNTKKTYSPQTGGIHPREAAQHHTQKASSIIDKAIKEAGISVEDLNIICFSQGPGLGPCLRTGAVAARALSSNLEIPLLGINHCVSHIEIGLLFSKAKDPITLYVSGGNTQVLGFTGGKYRIFGESLDIAIGNCLDKFAREAGIPHPGGPKIEKYAKNGTKLLDLPYVVKGMDLSFSGILTEAINLYRKGCKLEDICYSLQEYCFSMLVEVVERALAHTEKDELLLTGGVAANSYLQEMLKKMCKDRNANFYGVPFDLAGDNGAMIAWCGLLKYKSDNEGLNIQKSQVLPKWRADEVVVTWK